MDEGCSRARFTGEEVLALLDEDGGMEDYFFPGSDDELGFLEEEEEDEGSDSDDMRYKIYVVTHNRYLHTDHFTSSDQGRLTRGESDGESDGGSQGESDGGSGTDGVSDGGSHGQSDGGSGTDGESDGGSHGGSHGGSLSTISDELRYACV